MKKVLLVACMALSMSVFAQKFGHVDYSKLIQSMPEMDSAQAEMQSYSKDIEVTITTMQTELQNAYQDFQANQNQYTDLIKQTKMRALQEQQARLEDFYKQAQEDVQLKQATLMKPIMDKAKAAVAEVAKENKFSYVFNTASEADPFAEVLLYKPESDDILTLVCKKLGITPKP